MGRRYTADFYTDEGAADAAFADIDDGAGAALGDWLASLGYSVERERGGEVATDGPDEVKHYHVGHDGKVRFGHSPEA